MDLEIKIDEILDNGEFEIFNDHLYCADEVTANIDKTALTYFVGYVPRNGKKHSIAKICNDFFNSLVSRTEEPTDLNIKVLDFINMRNQGQ